MATRPHRFSDRVERFGRGMCVVVAVVGLLIALLLAWISHNAAVAEAERYADSVHRTAAVTLEDAPAMAPSLANVQPKVAAEWTGVDQLVHRGQVEVPRGTESGTRVTIWTDSFGEVSSAPKSHSQLVADTVLVAIAASMGVAAAVYGVHLLTGLVLGRLRSREWDLAWEDFARQSRLQ